MARHLGPSSADIERMCSALGIKDIEQLLDQAVPESIRLRRPLDLPDALTESQAAAHLSDLAASNRLMHNMIGLGYHDCITPAVIRRNLFENPGWYTAYTPYQAEISQGRLEMLLNFQQMISDLTGLPLAGASLLDEATAAAEAMALCRRLNPKAGNRFWVDAGVLPQTLGVLRTRAAGLDIELIEGGEATAQTEGVFAALIQYPAADGGIPDLAGQIAHFQGIGARTVAAADLLGLLLLPSPGSLGADVAIGSAQRFGVPLGCGGPHAAYMAVRDEAMRLLPGRLIGVSRDARGAPALRMALQTREQHIRRERATSNICTAQVLLANMAAAYSMYHGAEGLRAIAERVHRLTQILERGLTAGGRRVLGDGRYFDTLCIADANPAETAAAIDGINVRVGSDHLGISVNECTGREHIAQLLDALCPQQGAVDIDALDRSIQAPNLPALRDDAILTHPVFQMHRTETEMMRYLTRLERSDIALNHSMIGLGSCTMKLNAAVQMEAVSLPGFAHVHPFAPVEQMPGYLKLFEDLKERLAEITGFARISLQPNAGSQGEYAGLMCIRSYQIARGQGHRDLCLIPASAHGTNPASAVLAGFAVEVIRCDSAGNIDLDHLREILGERGGRVAALMLTYPSTHGVYEDAVGAVCGLVHDAGGQVYMDGANMNALLGLARPGDFGADVAHLNLHKTFCIPHGGGGPGVGAIGVAAHLAAYMPGHALAAPGPDEAASDNCIAAAPWGSASILPISWAYIAMAGSEGLRQSAAVAILSANYLAEQLEGSFPVLYRGSGGRVAHECILDLRTVKEQTGITEEDIAKRLMDYGFHAPTMSFPVPGTLMVEPTESESLAELERFIAAMRSIRAEVDAVASGELALEASPLRLAPHTQADLLDADWNRPYSREQGCFPAAWLHRNKYWPPVNRIDNVSGDRNPFCLCPPLEAYSSDAGALQHAETTEVG